MTTYDALITDKDGNIVYPQTKAENILDGNDAFASLSDFVEVDKRSKSTLESFNAEKSTNDENFLNIKSDIKTLNDFKDKDIADNTPWGNWDTNGMTLMNGAHIYSGDWDYPHFRTRKVNGNTQVQIQCRIKNITAGGDTPYIGFPLNLQPSTATQIGQSSPTTNGRTASWIVDNGVICLHATSDNNFNSEYWYPLLMTWEVN